jgi:serine/threonine protein kinase
MNMTNRTGTLIGSAEYIAPEQARGKAVPQSDLYSLGVTCIHLLTDISPFDLYDDVRDRWIWREKLPNPISNHLANILDRLLAKAIADRYSSANQVLQDLRSPKNSINIPLVITAQSHDYLSQIKQLQEVLSFGQWQEGDRLTNQIILKIANKQRISELTSTDIAEIPCAVWMAINQAWTESSNHHFGWTIQKQIWQSLGGKLIYEADTYWEFANIYEKFADRLGWRKPIWFNLRFSPKVWRKYKNLTFDIAAPDGHLPSLFFWEGFNLVDVVLYRLEICQQK